MAAFGALFCVSAGQSFYPAFKFGGNLLVGLFDWSGHHVSGQKADFSPKTFKAQRSKIGWQT